MKNRYKNSQVVESIVYMVFTGNHKKGYHRSLIFYVYLQILQF